MDLFLQKPSIEFLKTAYNEMGVSGEYWQRDNIYYGLTPNNTVGTLRRNIVEYIRSLQFSYQAFLKMKDQPGDPNFRGGVIGDTSDYPDGISQEEFWQDGYFEFKIDITINNQSGLGTNITKYLSVPPYDAFYLNYKRTKRFKWSLFEVTSIESSNIYPDIKLVTWDLQQNSFSWKFNFAEVDDQETYTTQESITSEFATNFGLGFEKIGLNFGGSAKTTKQSQYTRVTYKNSDELGTLEVNFSDPILMSFHGSFVMPMNRVWEVWDLYAVENPMVRMVLMPKVEY